MRPIRATDTLTTPAPDRCARSMPGCAAEARTRTGSAPTEAHTGNRPPRPAALPAEDLIARLARTPTAGSIELGYGRGLLCATLTELAEEPIMRDVITCSWAAHLGLGDTPDANASACFAALADVVGRLTGVAEAIHHHLDAAWDIDPDAVALGYAPPNAPVAAVCLLPREVRLRPRPHDPAHGELDAVRAQISPALDPLIGAWCNDGHLDPATTRHTLGRPTTANA